MDGTELTFRLLRRDDFPRLVGWLAAPHVARWWGAPKNLSEVEEEYGASVDGTDPTEVYIVEMDTTPVGLVQIYRLSDDVSYQAAVGVTDGAGIDLLIGPPEWCGRGLGPRIIAGAMELIWVHFPDVRRAVTGPSVHNLQSRRAFVKAGLHEVGPVRIPGEEDEEMILVAERPTAG